ncbi:MAG: bifunctional diaminohydroxyphosphoribosylaminopyrimidine deaminase/5-amino-6-(5-phosphoribosylamino)uracil reductase RibD [Isosphaeraceae bacterium]
MPPDHPQDPTDLDAHWMRLALAEAARGRGAVEPNPMVGAVVVRDGRIVGLGRHARFGGPHAEVLALAEAGQAARGATLYVTLEPCCHHGKTPPCADLVIESGVVRVVAALRDPFPKVDGGGLARLQASGIALTVGVEEAAARRLNAPYLKRLATGRPFVTAKWAMTLDGKMATAQGDGFWVSSPRSRSLVHELRGRMDAILVGIGTVLADDPRLNARPAGPRVAARIVLDSQARLPLASRLVATAGDAPVWVAVTDRAPVARRVALIDRGCALLEFPGSGSVPIGPLLDDLGRQGVTNLMVEGGGRILGAFFDEDQIDEVDVFLAPKIEGGPAVHAPCLGRGVDRMANAARLEETVVSEVDGDVRLQGRFPRPWTSHRTDTA